MERVCKGSVAMAWLGKQGDEWCMQSNLVLSQVF